MHHHFSEVYKLIINARQRTASSVNHELIELYWKIGQYIHHKTLGENWGKNIVNQLSEYIREKDPLIKGFSPQNLWRMKQFFEVYRGNKKLSALTREITWTNNMIIIAKAKTKAERAFYLQLCIQENYSSREIERQIESGLPDLLAVYTVIVTGYFL